LTALKELQRTYSKKGQLEDALTVNNEIERHVKSLGGFKPHAVVSSLPAGVTADIAKLKRGQAFGNNRGYKIENVPRELDGLEFLRMEVHERGDYEVQFDGKSTARLLVVTSRASPVDGKELEKTGWRRTGYQVTHDVKSTMMVFEREVENETVKVRSKGDWPYMIATDILLSIDTTGGND
jgi:hypothetical protein